MNRTVGGKPRAGKTKRCVVWVIEQLRTQPRTRPIVTNMALELHPWVDGKGVARRGLLRVLQDKYGETFNAEQRIYLLKHEEVARFYSIRPIVSQDEDVERQIEIVPKQEMWKFDANKYPGADFAIDESEIYFPSDSIDPQSRSKEDKEALQWAKQAGRGGDHALFISQNLAWISPRIRGTCQECWWMTNHVHISWGMFRRPDRITQETYADALGPQATRSLEWLTKTTFNYSREEIDSSYNTATGVGVTGNSAADIGQRAKGLHWSFIPAGIVALGIVACIGLIGFKKVVQAAFNGQQNGAKQAAGILPGQTNGTGLENAEFTKLQKAVEQLMAQQGTRPIASGVSNLRAQVVKSAPVVAPEIVIGITRGQTTIVTLDDGTQFEAKHIEETGRELAIDGVIYKRGAGKMPQDKAIQGKL
jgi:hypothetical protein